MQFYSVVLLYRYLRTKVYKVIAFRPLMSQKCSVILILSTDYQSFH